MTLTELKPRWFADTGRRGQGLTFLCPHCKQVRLAVALANPLDGKSPMGVGRTDQRRLWNILSKGMDYKGQVTVPPGFRWTRTGKTFATLTLTPSVDASASGHWHGFITAGIIR